MPDAIKGTGDSLIDRRILTTEGFPALEGLVLHGRRAEPDDPPTRRRTSSSASRQSSACRPTLTRSVPYDAALVISADPVAGHRGHSAREVITTFRQ